MQRPLTGSHAQDSDDSKPRCLECRLGNGLSRNFFFAPFLQIDVRLHHGTVRVGHSQENHLHRGPAAVLSVGICMVQVFRGLAWSQGPRSRRGASSSGLRLRAKNSEPGSGPPALRCSNSPTLAPTLETVLFRPPSSRLIVNISNSNPTLYVPSSFPLSRPLFSSYPLLFFRSEAHRCDEVSCCPQQIVRAILRLTVPSRRFIRSASFPLERR